MARIVDTDNFGGDYPDEKFLLWPLPQEIAERIVDALNDSVPVDASRFYMVVPDDYKLRPGFEP